MEADVKPHFGAQRLGRATYFKKKEGTDMFSRTKSISQKTDANFLASLYAAGVIGPEDINKLLEGKTGSIDKKDIPKRKLMELILIDNNGGMIPLSAATEEEKKAFTPTLWYSYQSKKVEDKQAIKDFCACKKALEGGTPLPVDGRKSTAVIKDVAKKGAKKPSSEPAEQNETAQPEINSDSDWDSFEAYSLSGKEFKKLDRQDQLRVIEILQEASGSYAQAADDYAARAAKFAKIVQKAVAKNAAADTEFERRYALLKTAVKGKGQLAMVDQLQESGADPVKAAQSFFDVDLIQLEASKGDTQTKDEPDIVPSQPQSDAQPEAEAQPESKADTSADDTPAQSASATETLTGEVTEGPTPKVQMALGAALIACFEKGGMPENDINLLKSQIDARKRYALGEVVAVVRQLGYDDASSVMQALQNM